MTTRDPFAGPAGSARKPVAPLSPLEQRLARVIYGYDRGILRTSRLMDATPAESMAAVGRTFPNAPFDLRLVDCLDEPARNGGALVFRVLAWKNSPYGDQLWFRLRLKAVFIDHLRLRVDPDTTSSHGSKLELSADLQHEVRIGTRWFLLPLMIAGAVGGAFGLRWLAERLLAPGDPALLVVAIIGALAGAIVGAAVLARWGRGAIGKARKQLDALLAATESSLRQHQAGTAPAP